MKRNNECIRDILSYIEDKSSYTIDSNGILVEHITISHSSIINSDELKMYDKKDIMYSIELLFNYGCIRLLENPTYDKNKMLANTKIIGLTWKGHDLADELRNI